MRPEVSINNLSMSDLGWLRESVSFPPVQSQSTVITVPGRSSPVRFTRMNGKISYQPRTFEIVLVMYGSRKKFLQMVSEASHRFAGEECRVIISERPDVYAVGTLQLKSSYDTSTFKGTLTISCQDADAWLYHVQETRVHYPGSAEASLPNEFMPVVPEFVCDADSTLTWTSGTETYTKTVTHGRWTFPELELAAGDNSVTVETEDDFAFVYREGRL